MRQIYTRHFLVDLLISTLSLDNTHISSIYQEIFLIIEAIAKLIFAIIQLCNFTIVFQRAFKAAGA